MSCFHGMGSSGIFHWLDYCLVWGPYPYHPLSHLQWIWPKCLAHFLSNFQVLTQIHTNGSLILCKQAKKKLSGNTSYLQIFSQNSLSWFPCHSCLLWNDIEREMTILDGCLANYFNVFVSLRWWVASRTRNIFNTHLTTLKVPKPLTILSVTHTAKACWIISWASAADFSSKRENFKYTLCSLNLP